MKKGIKEVLEGWWLANNSFVIFEHENVSKVFMGLQQCFVLLLFNFRGMLLDSR
jgi:hypothetical protein